MAFRPPRRWRRQRNEKARYHLIGGHAYSWRALLEARRAQLEAWHKARPDQPALFDLKEDHRPVAERTADGRYSEPSLLEAAIHKTGG